MNMKNIFYASYIKISIFLLLIFIFPEFSNCQIPDPPCDTTLAPEIWSQPVKLPEIVNIKDFRNLFPFISADGKTLYYCNRYGVCKSQLTDTGWTEPVKLTDRINGSGLAQSVSITADGSKLYFVDFDWSMYTWDIYLSNWDEKIKDWGYPINVKELNSDRTEFTVQVSRDGKTIFLNSNDMYAETMTGCSFGEIFVSYWNDTLKKWNPKINLGKNINYVMKCHELWYGGCGEYGGSMTGDGKKLYYCLDFGYPGNFDLFVSYRDSLGNWEKSRRLNINSEPDTSSIFYYRSSTGWDQNPSITPDGKTIYFSSRRNVYVNGDMDQIYMSKLLIDENGNTVTNIIDKKSLFFPDFELSQNYPNPFNPETIIKYEIKKRSSIKLVVYDITGREIDIIYEGIREPGSYLEKWDGKYKTGEKAATGTYFYCLQTGSNYKVKKMMLVK